MRARKYTSIILLVTFIILSVTGIQMDMTHAISGPHGPHGTEGGNNSPVIKESPAQPEDGFYPKRLHELMGYIFIIAALVHLKFNYKTLIR